MQCTTLALPAYLLVVLVTGTHLDAQVTRTEAERGMLDGFSIAQNAQWSGGARINGDTPNPNATYIFAGEDGLYDITVAYCEEDNGASSYILAGTSAGAIHPDYHLDFSRSGRCITAAAGPIPDRVSLPSPGDDLLWALFEMAS